MEIDVIGMYFFSHGYFSSGLSSIHFKIKDSDKLMHRTHLRIQDLGFYNHTESELNTIMSRLFFYLIFLDEL